MKIDYSAIAAFTGIVALIVTILLRLFESRRSRFSLGIELILKLDERFNSKELRDARRKAAKSLLNKDNTYAADDVLDFFEMIGILVRRGALDEKMVWHIFFAWLHQYCHSAKEHIEAERQKDSTVWEDLVRLHDRLVKIEMRERRCRKSDIIPSEDSLKGFLKDESEL